MKYNYISQIKSPRISQKSILASAKYQQESLSNIYLNKEITPEDIASLTKKQREIYSHLKTFREQEWISFKYEEIAKEVGCSYKTVQRTISLFEDHKIIMRDRVNRWAPWNFAIPEYMKKAVFTFMCWYLLLTPSQQHAYDFNNAKPSDLKNHPKKQNVLQNRNNNYILNPEPVTRARLTPFLVPKRTNDGLPVSKIRVKPGDTRADQLRIVGNMLTREQREWVQAHKSDPVMPEFLMSPQVKSLLYTPLMEELTSILNLDQRESLKLVAYHDEVLKYLLGELRAYLKGVKPLKGEIRDKMGWVNGILTTYSAKNNLKVNWKWYFDLCDILGIKALQPDEPPKPWYLPGKAVPEPAPEPKKLDMYCLYKPVVTPHEEKLAKCRENIAFTEKILANPDEYYKPEFAFLFSKAEWLAQQEKALADHRKELQELEAIYTPQVL